LSSAIQIGAILIKEQPFMSWGWGATKVRAEEFNCLEVMGIVTRDLVSIPYVVVSAHSRHIQKGFRLNDPHERRAAQQSTKLHCPTSTAQKGNTLKNLYVGNLAFSTTEQELRALFEIHGVVEPVNIVTDKETGRPRGCAFVEMTNPGEADKAAAAITGSSLGGRLEGE
jgi:hypothetical protein